MRPGRAERGALLADLADPASEAARMAPSDPLALQPLGQRPADRLRKRLPGQRRQCAGEAVGLSVLQA